MKILILGGTQFVGKNFAKFLSDKNYNFILANRGVSGKADIIIDRNNGHLCKNLNNNYYDIVVDFSCYSLEQLINVLNNIKYNKYIFISTSGIDYLQFNSVDSINYKMQSYINNKKLCEDFIIENMKNCNIIRPCYIVGQYDYTNRFYKLGDKYFWKNGKELTFYIEAIELSQIIFDSFNMSGNNIIRPCSGREES